MINIGITGQNGFIGWHLLNTLKLSPNKYCIINFDSTFFSKDDELDKFVTKCDVIVHLAGVNRGSETFIRSTNLKITQNLINALSRTRAKPHIMYASSVKEFEGTEYGESKKASRILLDNFCKVNCINFVGLVIPNVFGPFCRPHYNSVIATFCYQLCNEIRPTILVDSNLKLLYVGELVQEILLLINESINNSMYIVSHSNTFRVSTILDILEKYDNEYRIRGNFPMCNSNFEVNLFNTYRSYIDHQKHFPRYYNVNSDSRGDFVVINQSSIPGQYSYSTTKCGFVRGNHFHTRKIERFSVIKGKALISLKRVSTKNSQEFVLDGENPAWVDIPIWHLHTLANIGVDELVTVFWISEFYDEQDSDTFYARE